MPAENMIESTVRTLKRRSLSGGGFTLSDGESFRADATAWAVLALEASGFERGLTISACRRLARIQLSDGRISAVEGHPEAYWPTSLAVLAWRRIPGFEKEANLAVSFLIEHTGEHFPKDEKNPVSHDSSLKGWPWVENTHSWIEPTALAILALRACRYGDHERVLEAVRMILDRQLPAGGWNYGNTFVFGKELRPIPECTGHALCALSGYTALHYEWTRGDFK